MVMNGMCLLIYSLMGIHYHALTVPARIFNRNTLFPPFAMVGKEGEDFVEEENTSNPEEEEIIKRLR